MPVRNIFVVALTAIVSLTCYTTASKNRYATLFADALETIEKQALQDVPREDLFRYAMDGMTSNLDGHSRYISGDEFTSFSEDIDQEFGGVGMYVETDPTTEELTVLAPIPGTPAFESGVKSGDKILKIAGKSTHGIDRMDAIQLIRGPRGAVVEILVASNGVKKLHRLERALIHEPSVHGDFRNADGEWNYHLKEYPQVGYLRLIQFGAKSADEMKMAVSEINDDVGSLILDLRNNAGGLLDGAIEICDFFLDKGLPIVTTRGRKNVLLEKHDSRHTPIFNPNKPMVILINRGSASASEIVSGCLQDHGRAILIGETTWGKGTVQHVIPIQRNQSALKLTTASYWRPSGKNIDRYHPEAQASGDWGVDPDKGKEIELTEEEIFLNRKRRSFLDLRGLIDSENLAERDEENLSDVVDEPLQRAIKYLLSQSKERVAA